MQKSDLLSDTLTNREINGNYNLPFLKQHQTERNVLLDFIRGSSIYLVVLVHILLSIEQVLEQRDALSSSLKARLDLAFRQFIQFGMPLFFYVSGRSTAYTKSNLISGIIKKTVRLVPPLLFGMFFVVIPTQYLSKNFIPQKCSPSGDNSFLEYYKNYVFGINNYFSVCGFWWLWFIVVLYAVSVTNLPIVLEHKNEISGKSSTKENFGWIALISLCFNFTFLFCNDPLYVYNVIFMEFFYLSTHFAFFGKRGKSKFTKYFLNISFNFGMSVLHTVLSTFMMRYSSFGNKFKFLMASYPYYYFFHHQGILDELYPKSYRFKNDTIFRILIIIFQVVTVIFFAPLSDSKAIFSFPNYTDYSKRLVFVLSSWAWILLLFNNFKVLCKEEDGNDIIRNMNNNTIVLYVFHYLFIALTNKFFVVPLGLSFKSALISHLLIVSSLSFLIYVIILKFAFLRWIFGIK